MGPGYYIVANMKNLTAPTAMGARFFRNPNWSGEWEKRYFPESDASLVRSWAIDGCTAETDTQLWYHMYLASIEGAGFVMFREPGTSDDTVKAAKRELRRKYDVVRIEVIRIRKWIEPQPTP